MNEPGLAVFSDVHANLEALEAVFSDMEALGIKNRVCVGDTVGYGPSPAACLKLIRSTNCPILLGNHDESAATELPLENMRDVAIAGIEFSRQNLSDEEKEFLSSLPLVVDHEGCQFVHASLIAPPDWNYITRESDAYLHFNRQVARVCFAGHTHVPMIWQNAGPEMPGRQKGAGKFLLQPKCKYLINVGSVGQPRDLNPFACYVIYKPGENSVEFRRVKYDIAKTKSKITKAKLPKFLGQRLSLGR